MSEEEKKAINILLNEIGDMVIGFYCTQNKCFLKDKCIDVECRFNTAIDTTVNLIEKQQKEIEKKDKVIDEMAEVLNDFDYDKQCESCHTDLCSASVDRTGYTKCIKEYFYRRVEEDEV